MNDHMLDVLAEHEQHDRAGVVEDLREHPHGGGERADRVHDGSSCSTCRCRLLTSARNASSGDAAPVRSISSASVPPGCLVPS